MACAAVVIAQHDVAPITADPASRVQVLFIGSPTQNGPHHDPITRYRALKRGLGIEGIDLTYSEDPAAAFRSYWLRHFDAVLLYANWHQLGVMPESQLQALLDFVASGGGFVPVHCASACWGRSPQFVRLVGARFVRHGGEEFAVETVLPEHPAIADTPGYRAWDETYEHEAAADDRTILQRRGDEAWTWVRSHGAGRVFYTASGHDHRVWDLPQFQRLLRNGILWAVGDEARARLERLALPQLEHRAASLPGYRERREIVTAQEPLSPTDSQKLAQVPVGMELRLFASEPQIVNPIYIAWDQRGRAHVIETIDYPNNLRRGELGNDRITICEDRDGDGRADHFTRFAEGLSIPTALTFADGGVICTDGTDMVFLADTDGDDRADVRRVLFRGFHMGDTHAGASNLRYGLDGWIYATIGYSGFEGEVGGERHSFAQGVFRFRPDGKQLEFLQRTTNNTWGLGFTSAGDVVGSTANGNPSWYLTFADARYRAVGLEPHHTPRADDDPIFAPMSTDIRQVDFFDHYTAAAGHAVYTAQRFGTDYHDRAAFVCEPTGKLVGMFTLERSGAGFRAVQSPNNLFASADAWTSPVCAEVGPDGAVWICDWYNLIVQHNPTPTRNTAGIDARTGRGNAYETALRDVRHGRIWRVFPTSTRDDEAPDLTDNDACLCALAHENLLWRLHAQRLLIERSDPELAAPLAAIVARGDVASPHALHALATLRILPEQLLTDALSSPQIATRRAALALADVAVLKRHFVRDARLPLAGRELAELLVRLAESADDPAIGAAILHTAIADELAIFDDVTLRDAWQIAARRHAKTVCAAADDAGLVAAAPAAPINLLPDPSFDTAADARGDAWTDLRIYSRRGAEPIVVRRDTGGRDGSDCLRIESASPVDCGVAVSVPVRRGTRYRLSGSIRTDLLEPNRGSDGAMLNVHGGVRTQGVRGTSDWQRVSVEFEADEDADIVVHCLFGGYGGARGTAWFDDVELIAIGGGTTLRDALVTLRTLAAGDPTATHKATAPANVARAHPIDDTVHARGAAVYARTCIACHGIDGAGLFPAFPPLDGSLRLTGASDRVIDIVLHGLAGPLTAGGKSYDGVMPPLGPTLSDEEVADVITFVRQRWSNDATPVSPSDVATRRELHRGRTALWTVQELDH